MRVGRHPPRFYSAADMEKRRAVGAGALAGVGLGFAWVPALLLAVIEGIQVARGLFAMLLLGVLGTPQLFEWFMRRHFSSWTRDDD